MVLLLTLLVLCPTLPLLCGLVLLDVTLPTFAALVILLLLLCKCTDLVSYLSLSMYRLLVRWGLETYVWQEVYDLLLRLYPSPEWKMLNHGYAGLTESGYTIELAPSEEFERYSYQLYHHVGTGMLELKHFRHLDVLEVGCGRGGGLSFLHKYMFPASALGVDILPRAVSFCAQRYASSPGLSFLVGASNRLPVASESKDIVIDICNSHCYTDFPSYIAEVYRVLRPNGRFFIADFRPEKEVRRWEESMSSSGLMLEKKEDISEEVYTALKFDSLRRSKLIRTAAGPAFRRVLEELACVQNSRFYTRLERREIRYLAFKFTK